MNPDASKVLPVSELVRQARRALESALPLGWVAGEVSGLTRASSGHLYFTLKDETAQLRCTMWRNRAQLLPFQLSDGMQVEVRAQLTVYEARGDMQLAVDHIRRAGLGSRFEALMRLKAKLTAEGLFDPALRRPLPALARRVGIVTSPAGAALHDVLVTLRRRAPALQVVIYPSLVQGDEAGPRIAQAIRTASARAEEDGLQALIVCRGGGSAEDLWAFNDEAVVRAVRACAVPVISGVGHETDTTLCDFAADLRAATPTAAAEAVSGGHQALRAELAQHQGRLAGLVQHLLRQAAQRLDLLERSLHHPRQGLAQARARLAHLALRLSHSQTRSLQSTQRRLEQAGAALRRLRPDTGLHRLRSDHLGGRLERALEDQTSRSQQRLAALGARLQALNPAAVMQRGYAVVRDRHGRIVRDATTLEVGEQVALSFASGSAEAEILQTHRESQSS